MLITTIIVSYNTADLTCQAIKSVIDDALKNQIEHEVIVVDNASSDNSVKKIKQLTKKFSQVRLFENKKNLGFAKANNQAIKKAKGEFIFLLNSDAQVIPGSLTRLAHALQTNQALGIVSPLLLNPDKTLQNQGGDLPSLFSVANQMFFLDDLPIIGQYLPSPQKKFLPKKSPTYMGWVAGTAMMIKSEVIDQVGFLDEKIFMYAEDVDYCWRARQQGFQIALVPEAKVIHYGSASSSSARAIEGEFLGLIYLFKKHQPSWKLSFLKLILLTGASLRVVLFAIIGQKEKSLIYKQVLDKLH